MLHSTGASCGVNTPAVRATPTSKLPKDYAYYPYIPFFSFDLGELKAYFSNPALRDIAAFATPKGVLTTSVVNCCLNPKWTAREDKVVLKRRVADL